MKLILSVTKTILAEHQGISIDNKLAANSCALKPKEISANISAEWYNA